MTVNGEATQSGADANELAEMFADKDNEAQVNGQADATTGEELELNLDPENAEEVEVETDDSDPELELKVDGKTVKVKQSQLIADAQKYHSATKRFEEAAAIRKDAEAKMSQLPEREQQLGNVLQHYIRETQALMASQQPNWDQLLAQDPARYLQVRHAWEQRQGQLQEAQRVKATIDQRNAEAKAVANQGRITQEREKLLDAIPAWKDPKKAAEGAHAIDGYLAERGIPAEMRGAIDSSAVLLIAHKAMLYDQAMARQKAARNGVQTPTRVARPGVSSNTTPKSQVQRTKAQKAFSENPSVDTLASFF